MSRNLEDLADTSKADVEKEKGNIPKKALFSIEPQQATQSSQIKRKLKLRNRSASESSVAQTFKDESSSETQQTLAMASVEPSPHADNYANETETTASIPTLRTRPSLTMLHSDSMVHIDMGPQAKNDDNRDDSFGSADQNRTEKKVKPHVKLGWIEGVLIRSSLSVFGVIFYLRLTWIQAQAGIALASVIVIVSSLVGLLTGISLSAICTNGRVQSGGVYYIISRTLGAEFGGSIGIIFSLGNVTAAAITVLGFAETIVSLMQGFAVEIVDGATMDIRIIGWITATVLLVIVFTGVSFEAKAQLILMVILLASVTNYYVGTFLEPSIEARAKGIVGYDAETMKNNFLPDWRGEDFFSVLAIYFPAVAGFMTGANISGDLKNPETAIPKGTLLSIVITSSIYLSVMWMTGASSLRDASGSIEDLQAGTLTECAKNFTCMYGTHNNYQTLELEGAWGPLVTAGIFAASLSSALGAMVSGPKLFQAIAKDRLFPKLDFFEVGYGQNHEPRRAIIFTFILTMALVGIGDINAIAPMISNFFMATYALINYACFDASFSQAPGFRPSFKFYNKWISLLGAAICFALMFLINWWAALITTAFAITLYVYLLRRKPDVNWGSSLEANSYLSSLRRLLKLQFTREHVKTYRPQILLLTGSPIRRPELVDFASNITKNSCLLVCGHVILGTASEQMLEMVERYTKHMIVWLKARRIYAFYSPVVAPTVTEGVQYLLQMSGISGLKPNILFLGYKGNWIEATEKEIQEYFQIIHYGFDHGKGLAILRLPKGFDISSMLYESNFSDSLTDGLSAPEQYAQRYAVSRDDRVSPLRTTASMDSVFTDSVGLYAYENPRFKNSRLDLNSEKTSIDIPSLGTVGTEQNGLDSVFNDRKHRNSNMKIIMNDSEIESSIDAASIRDLNFEMVTSSTHAALKGRKKKSIMSKVIKHDRRRKSAGTQQLNVFKKKIKKAVIDVWWLYDDGGLTLLLPYLLTIDRSYLEGAKLRIFTSATDPEKADEQKTQLADLFAMFRIDVKDVFVIPDILRNPQDATMAEFNQLMDKFKTSENNSLQQEIGGDFTVYTDDVELASMKLRTNEQLRIREEMLQHSKDANLVVVTLPVPRKKAVSATLYLAWLEMLTKDMPPVLLVRGNQKSVLTYQN
ncbi:solute carrier family 12 [Trichuris trichiura]|uniref:Solute carrier family 12 n=1 Tax=Trichuris trichiura TaxID=36087 RepID=A0A077ZGV7_TRITR|nr:solute carrier family 12 [Trichuris trichiura]